MSDIIDGLGTAAEGGLFARVLEPPSGAKAADPHQPDHCLNCGTTLTGAYCHACGQPGHVHRTIGAFGHDLLHGALHFEGKLWRTLPMLALRPGALTRRYIEGQRARFVSPMALFLFGVFLMFAVFQMIGLTAPTDLVATNVPAARVQAEAARAQAQAELDAMAPDDPARAGAEQSLAVSEAVLGGLTGQTGVSTQFSGTGIEAIDQGLIKKWQENPGLLLYKLQSNSYKFSWLLIPISVPFVALLFAWRRRYGLYDHAIFVTYSLSFMTLLFVVISLLPRLTGGELLASLAAFCIPPLHIYKQLRGAYQLSRLSALWRLVLLMGFIAIIIVLFLQVLLILGAF